MHAGSAAHLHDFCELRIGHHEDLEEQLPVELIPADIRHGVTRRGVCELRLLLLQPLLKLRIALLGRRPLRL